MLNPFDPQREPGPSSYVDLKKRVLKKVQATNVNDQIFVLIQSAFENVMNSENPRILLSRPERKRLFSQILRSVLEDMIRKMDERSSSTQA
jgi:hypothetical protein